MSARPVRPLPARLGAAIALGLGGCASPDTTSSDQGVADLGGGCVTGCDQGVRDLTSSRDLTGAPDLVAAGDMTTTTASGHLFPDNTPWYTAVDKAALDGESDAVIAALQATGGWGARAKNFQIDFAILVLSADANTPTRDFTPTGDWFDPDCDQAAIPIPPGGAIEGEAGYQCAGDGDCHLIVVDRATAKLYEMWRADILGPMNFNGGCLAVWDMTRVYPDNGRGENCTSADAGGFSIAALLPGADEVFAAAQTQGSLDHALRFILPNAKIRANVYVHPGSHTTGATSGGPMLPPYGARLRLRPDYPLDTLPSEASRVIARTLMTYGMFLADGGDIALTFADDRFATHPWATMNFDSHSMFGIQPSDFQMVDGGKRHTSGDCVRNP